MKTANKKSLIKNYASIIFILLITLSHYKCNTNRQESPLVKNLPLVKITPIKVSEPSGLTLSFDGKYFWCVGDNDSKVFKLDLKGRLNEGLEGICYDSRTKNFYFLNEKRPGLLIKTDSTFEEIFRKELTFAKDYSDIFFSNGDNTLWILSDESQKIIQTDLSGNKILEYGINVKQPEGLVVDYELKKIFIVSDKKEELYEFKLP